MFDIHKKDWLYENGAGKKIVGLSKLKLWTVYWDHGEQEWPFYIRRKYNNLYSNNNNDY